MIISRLYKSTRVQEYATEWLAVVSFVEKYLANIISAWLVN
jgi:hypothetical protein